MHTMQLTSPQVRLRWADGAEATLGYADIDSLRSTLRRLGRSPGEAPGA